jgi:DGQHR domain-containing protein
MRFDALKIVQPSGREVYAFAATAEQILRVTTVPRIGRDYLQELVGYQRAEVSGHIAEIRRYLDTERAILANPIVVAFDDSVSFVSQSRTALGEFGHLDVPESTNGGPPPGAVVDGQQRLAALSSCRESRFTFYVTGFVAPNTAEQRKQFVLVNRAKPLPRGLVYELVTGIEDDLPPALARDRMACVITTRLNVERTSSLYHKIKTVTWPHGLIKDNSIRRMLSNSLTDGALFHLAEAKRNGNYPVAEMTEFVSTYWAGVARAFPEAFNLPPNRSRLTHGVGIAAMGFVMEQLATRFQEEDWNPATLAEVLSGLSPCCAWTSGVWPLGAGKERPWNEFQNIDRDIRALTTHLRRALDAILYEGEPRREPAGAREATQ